MNTFAISPSEAFLLGICWGEYSMARESFQPEIRLVTVLERRLRPWMPSVRQTTVSSVDEADIPPNVQWNSSGLVGVVSDDKERMYLKEADGYKLYHENLTDKSLIELIVQYLDGCIGLSEQDRSEYWLMKNGIAKLLWLRDQIEKGNTSIADRSEDTVQHMQVRLQQLVAQNESFGYFNFGEQIGTLLSKCQKFEDDSHFACAHRDDDEDKWMWETAAPGMRADQLRDWETQVNSLLDSRHGRLLKHSRPLLTGSDHFALEHDEILLPHPSWESQQFRVALGVAIGEALAKLHEADCEVIKADPRMFARLQTFNTHESALTRVTQQIEVVEHALMRIEDLSPAALISMLTNGIEALLTQVFPDVPQLKKKMSMSRVLDYKVENSKGLQERFARQARALHELYRNEATHELISLKAGPDDLQQFISGLRLLRQHAGEILDD